MQSTQNFALRTANKEDRPFLYLLYSAVNFHEIEAMEIENSRRETFLMSRFSIQYRRFQQEFPGASMYIIEHEGEPVGRVYFEVLDKEIYLIDLSIMPEHQHHGIGSEIIKQLQHKSCNIKVPIVAEIEHYNQSFEFFLQNNFDQTGEEDIYLILEWYCPKK
ncbi:MAG: GNAT family N-acetyltransferase [bacterium]